MPSIWDHDLWQDIYAIENPEMKRVCVRLYTLILDMHNKDVMAEQISAALKGERRLYLTIGQKAFAAMMAVLVATDTVLHFVK